MSTPSATTSTPDPASTPASPDRLLSTEFRLGSVTLPNRLVMTPMESGLAAEDGS
ncbi:hypothetical protein JSY14_07490 [Brachybacterium sp. EF45031]|uniref:hypothetical protein n=1 Tax=Brachybacterium sillae TaxID=2810536 RepID=UPI00217E1837|nr:hypothetical protein [Brachybacterium sillae]MCS6711871.1 hypothetical protein [Brachybacterium sillae]